MDAYLRHIELKTQTLIKYEIKHRQEGHPVRLSRWEQEAWQRIGVHRKCRQWRVKRIKMRRDVMSC